MASPITREDNSRYTAGRGALPYRRTTQRATPDVLLDKPAPLVGPAYSVFDNTPNPLATAINKPMPVLPSQPSTLGPQAAQAAELPAVARAPLPVTPVAQPIAAPAAASALPVSYLKAGNKRYDASGLATGGFAMPEASRLKNVALNDEREAYAASPDSIENQSLARVAKTPFNDGSPQTAAQRLTAVQSGNTTWSLPRDTQEALVASDIKTGVDQQTLANEAEKNRVALEGHKLSAGAALVGYQQKTRHDANQDRYQTERNQILDKRETDKTRLEEDKSKKLEHKTAEDQRLKSAKDIRDAQQKIESLKQKVTAGVPGAQQDLDELQSQNTMAQAEHEERYLPFKQRLSNWEQRHARRISNQTREIQDWEAGEKKKRWPWQHGSTVSEKRKMLSNYDKEALDSVYGAEGGLPTGTKTATNPTTGEKLLSRDGGKTWEKA